MTSPHKLWQQAHDEHPRDPEARRIRYIELMREQGHIVPTLPGQSRDLPCGWPSSSSKGATRAVVTVDLEDLREVLTRAHDAGDNSNALDRLGDQVALATMRRRGA